MLILLGAVLLAACLWALFTTAGQSRRAMADGVFVVTPRVTGTDEGFSAAELTRIALDMPGTSIAFEASGSAYIANGGLTAYVPVVYTNAAYADMNSMAFTEGAYFPALRERENVIVLSNALVWKLFGGSGIVGRRVTIDGVSYEIVGVTTSADMTEASFAAWLPYYAGSVETGAEQTPDAAIRTLYLRHELYNKIDGYRRAEQLFMFTWKDRAGYYVTDMNEYVLSIARRPVLVLSALYCVVALAFLLRLLRLTPALLRRERGFLLHAAEAALCLGIVVFLLLQVDFRIWVAGFEDGLAQQLWAALTNAGRLPAPVYLARNLRDLVRLNETANVAAAGCLAGAAVCVAGLLTTWQERG